jgi:capsular polysaccharide biosynthesis protein
MGLQTSSQREATTLLLESVARRKLPVNFREGERELFSHELERAIPKTSLLKLHNVWASPEGILFKRGEMLPISFAFPSNRAIWKKRAVLKFLAGNYLLKKRRRFERESLWIVDDWSDGYFHWLTDSLTRLFTVKNRLDTSVLLLPHQHRRLGFVQPSLEPFGVRHLEFIGPDEVLICKDLVVPTQTAPSGHYHEDTIRAVGKLLSDFYASTTDSGSADRVYVSRSRARMRKILNEDEVINILRESGFKIINAEDVSFEQQVKLASGARYLISNHGAGLTNMLFMREGSSVLELRHNTDRINNCYFTLASALNHRYFYQTCTPENPHEDAHTANLLVDVGALRENLKLMLGS